MEENLNITDIKQSGLSDSDTKLIQRELEIHEKVKLAVKKQALLNRVISSDDITREIEELREQAIEAHSFDLPTFVQQIEIQKKLLTRKKPVPLPDLRSPYFAHIEIFQNGKLQDILIGHETFIDNELDVKIIDWRNAPIAHVFFEYRVGDSYEENIKGRVFQGEVKLRNILTFEKGVLSGIKLDSVNLMLDNGTWIRQESTLCELKGGQSQATRGFTYTGRSTLNFEISSLLDQDQYQALNQDESKPLLILGQAGCGKTTVALHRISSLFYKDPQKFTQHKQLVLVPAEGLARLSRKLLANLRMEKVRVMTFDDWMSWQCRYLIKDLPTTTVLDTPPRVSRFKRSSGILKVLPLLEKIRIKDFSNQVKDKLYFIPKAASYFETAICSHLTDRVKLLRAFCQKELEGQNINQQTRDKRKSLVDNVCSSLYQQIFWIGRDRIELLSNMDLLNKVIEYSTGLQPSIAKEVYARGVLQFSEKTESVPEGFDPVDNKAIDEDTPFDLADTIDIEDYSIMLAILRQYTGDMATPLARIHTYSHIVLDEAQELSPVDLSVISSTLEEDSSVTIAGDGVQQTDETTVFSSWEEVLTALKVEHVDPLFLKTNYRTTRQIFEYANKILAGGSSTQVSFTTRSIKDGPRVNFTRYFDEGISYLELKDVVENLMYKEPKSSLAIICKDSSKAESVFEILKDSGNVRLVTDGKFEFTPGVDITTVPEIKGLEFDYVIIPDADSKTYPDTDEARRALHVAVTRAIHQLWVLCVGVKSFILPEQ